MRTREKILMDSQWRFYKGDFQRPTDGQHWAKGAGCDSDPIPPGYDDSRWRILDLPHDFVVEGEFTQEQPVGATGGAMSNHMMHGYLRGGVGWYRKTFFIPAEDEGRVIALEFDGVFRNSTVWLNKSYVGTQAGGYLGFRYDVSALLNYGAFNTVVVRVDATEYEGWFYEGGGIYRHVWMIKQDSLRIAPRGVFVSSEANLSERTPPSAKITIKTAIINERTAAVEAEVQSEILDPAGKKVAELKEKIALDSDMSRDIVQATTLSNAELWSLEQPRLYILRTRIVQDGRTTDEETTSFGIRKIHFDADNGFFLNDQPVKIQGVCCHQDHAGVGSALPDRLHYFRIERLKEMGCNAYRCAHHPPAPELLDACDRLGMLVMDETRLMGTAPDLMERLSAMVRRDRNHPSVLFWSIGNEELFLQGTPIGARIAREMKREIHRWDTTRPITLAMNGNWGEGASSVLDVQGCNYIGCGNIDAFHKKFPHQPIVYSEAGAAVATRGIYENDKQRGYLSAYDVNAAVFGNIHEENWKHCVARPFVSGTFIWTGFDYRGEPTPIYNWPCISSHFGIIDTCGYPKDVFYYYQAWWSDRDVLHLFPHWNWVGREGQEIEMWVYSNCDEVALDVNGESLGRKDVPRNGHLVWKVPYAPGTVTAVGYRAGREIKRIRVETTGPAAAIRLVPDRKTILGDGEDVSVVRVEVIDAAGRLVPTANVLIRFSVEGPGAIIGVGNGDPSCHEADKGTIRSVFNGLAQVIVQSRKEAGTIRLKAVAEGIMATAEAIEAQVVQPRPSLSSIQLITGLRMEQSALPAGEKELLKVEYPPAEIAFDPMPVESPESFFTLRKYFEKNPDAIVYIRMTFTADGEAKGRLLLGPDGPVKVWVNGVLLATDLTPVPPAKPESMKINADWEKGANEIVVALSGNQGKTWGLYGRPCMG